MITAFFAFVTAGLFFAIAAHVAETLSSTRVSA